MTPAEIADRQSSLISFTRHMLSEWRGEDLIDNWHLDVVAAALERVVIGDCRRLIINVPPRTGKTLLAVKALIAWALGIYPDSEFIHASYSASLAAYNTFDVRDMLLSDAYRQVFVGATVRGDSKAKAEFRTTAGGIVYATGVGGTITGYGAGKKRKEFGGAVIIDDPHKADEALSDTMRAHVIGWFANTIESRLNNRSETPIIVVMQRLHEDDLSGWLLGGGNGEEWEHVCIPAIGDAGESFWESEFPLVGLERMRAASPYVFAGQYEQRPAPLGGGIFRDAWWRYYTALPALEWRAVYADTAQKTKEANDWSVFQCWGRSIDGQAVLIDQSRGKWEAPELRQAARDFWGHHKAAGQGLGPLRSMDVEDKVSGTDLIQTLAREGIPVRGVQRNRDKVTRAMDAAPFIESGNVLLPREAPWLKDYKAEFGSFPNGRHDDQVDPTMDAISAICGHVEAAGFMVL